MSATTSATLDGTWVADPIHSTASFAIKHMIVSTFRTRFKQIDATLEAEGDDVRLTGTVPVESIDIEQPDFRAHLMSPDFFDAENHPNITFVSTTFRRGEGESIDVDGDLTVKGVTRPVTASGILVGPAVNVASAEVVGIELQTTLDKNDFNLNWNAPLPKGGFAISDDVTLSVHLELGRKKED
jgi:polyisoprenoid-binding protein YceI